MRDEKIADVAEEMADYCGSKVTKDVYIKDLSGEPLSYPRRQKNLE